MKGWVYVISNRAMPDLIKVGFTLKDPALRAAELNNTGSPHPYTVDYEVLVNEPRDMEQKVHSRLSHCREGKEWFRCTVAQAIYAIQSVAGDNVQIQNFVSADNEARVEALRLASQARQAQYLEDQKIAQIQQSLAAKAREIEQAKAQEIASLERKKTEIIKLSDENYAKQVTVCEEEWDWIYSPLAFFLFILTMLLSYLLFVSAAFGPNVIGFHLLGDSNFSRFVSLLLFSTVFYWVIFDKNNIFQKINDRISDRKCAGSEVLKKIIADRDHSINKINALINTINKYH